MPLDRFTNQEEILNTDGLVRGVEWREGEYDALALDNLSVSLSDVDQLETELYVYTPQTGQYVNGGVTDKTSLRDGKLYIDYAGAIADFGIERGPFEVVVNIHQPVIGNYEEPILLAKEFSPDRREVVVKLAPYVVDDIFPQFLEEYDDAFELDLALNFGDNRVYKVINFKEWRDSSQLAIRLYQPIPEDVELNSPAWLVEQLSDSYIDNVDLSVQPVEEEVVELRGPNFEIDAAYSTITETDFQSWNQLLDANLSTSQQIVDRVFSGSLSGVNLGIDYSAFDNFVFYSSAAERVANFKYKLELIEYYNNRIAEIEVGSNTDDGALQGNIATARKRRDNVIGGFDAFERYLYNDPTSSLFTHHDVYTDYRAEGGFIGAGTEAYQIQPWPKYIQDGKYVLHTVDSSLGTSWYDGVYASASLYDSESETSLVKTIPEHIRNDANNDQYELFVNMIGHHFDVLYTYVDALTKTYKPQEHPKLGRSKEILYDVAESLGWKLANGNQASALWQYALGVDSGSGAYAQTGSIFSKSNEDITTEVWRRIVNNLPYILKTRGTGRSVKALMNAYGIPQTLLSVREYGGPKVSGDVPALIEDRFSYALQINSGSHIKISQNSGALFKTREIRFKPAIKQSMTLFSFEEDTTGHVCNVGLIYTGSYSGSNSYGQIVISDKEKNVETTTFLPLYDGEFWNLRMNTDAVPGTSHEIKVQKASDYITGKVIHSGSTAIISEQIGGHPDDFLYIGGAAHLDTGEPYNAVTSSSDDTFLHYFSGSIQEYREWLDLIDDDTFNLHTLNPTSYVATSDPTASYDELFRHLPLGTDLDAIDLSTDSTRIMSKHPKSGSAGSPWANYIEATTHGFDTPENAERGNFEPVEETYYIQGVSLGANTPRSQKIRLEDNELIRRLSPTNTAERSSFDFAPIDSNKLGLFYSHADQVNKDIFNQIGDVELDDYVGDPDDEFEFTYPDLYHFSKKYWKKFANKNDVNAFIRIFSQFDFSLFNQIRQLLPERVDEAMGILVEPHALERAKEILTKRPDVTNPQFEGILPEPSRAVSGSLPMYSASIAVATDIISAETLYRTPSGSNNDEINVSSSNLPGNYIALISNPFTGTGSLDPVVDDPRLSGIFKQVVFHYSGSPAIADKKLRNNDHFISQSKGLYYSQSLKAAAYMDDFFASTEQPYYEGSKISCPGVNIDSTIAALGNKPVIEVYEANANQLIYTTTPEPIPGGSKLIVPPGNINVR